MLSVLPVSLVALLFASPVFSEPTSFNDPFRAITLQKPKQPDNPICCLKPLTTTEPVDDAILLSFEEWKMKQSATQRDGTTGSSDKDPNSIVAGPGDGTIPTEGNSPSTDSPGPPVENPTSPSFANSDQLPSGPHFRVPLTDRFNYASLDCSARVHAAHHSAKSPASILSSKKDRYMLSPCDKAKENQFVVVELCDDIRIDTVQLANFEFFSGVFKDFTVSVAKNYDPEGWTPVATYRAKNVRGVQSFHPPRSLRDFYRFIRIDFLSNYGNEYYCPISLLRVYGLTHLEEWKWDVWESESRSKQAEKLKKKELPSIVIPESQPTPIADSDTNTSVKASTTPQSGSNTTAAKPHGETNLTSTIDATSVDATKEHAEIISNQTNLSDIHAPHLPSSTPNPNETPQGAQHNNTKNETLTHSTDTYVSTLSTPSIPSPSENQRETPHIPTSSSEPSTTGIPTSISMPSDTNISSNTPLPSETSKVKVSSGTPTIIISSSTPSTAVVTLTPGVKGGESIYRTIMNRLAEVEINQTLYMRYIEQQNLAVREVIKRLGEDVGRLEGISRAQSVIYQRTLNEFEKQRYQMEMEYGDLISRIHYLSEEIVLEKRLGIAQLCLLLAVLIFLGLTRGSRAETLVEYGPNRLNRSVREWGKRHFSIRGDWAGRFRGTNSVDLDDNRVGRGQSRSTSRTRTPPPTSSRPKPKSIKSYPPHLPLHLQENEGDDNTITFPSTSLPYRTKEPLETIQLNTAPLSNENFHRRSRTISNPRSRAPSLRSTPTARRTHVLHSTRPITPTMINTFRPQTLQRSSSHGLAVAAHSGTWGSMSVPKSAKKWARTAHLHEVKSAGMGPANAFSGMGGGSRKFRKGDDPRSGGGGGGGLTRLDPDRDRDLTPREFDFGLEERENQDLFSSAKAKSLSGRKGKAEPVVEVPTPPPSNSLLFKAEDDGDPWVDTDSFDGSEADVQFGDAM